VSPQSLSAVLLALAITVGTVADRPRTHAPLTIGGFRVLAVDFHTHSSMWSDGTLTPFGLVLEARWQGLDAIAITGHNEVLDGRIGHWFSRLVGGPTVLRGQEVLMPHHHLIAAGINGKINFLQSAAATIDDIHRHGGIAIAAHPGPDTGAYDEAAMERLDGAEICHPAVYAVDGAQLEYEQFAARAPLAAIGSSDYHGLGPMGLCRTYVFVRDNSEQAILDAVRAHRTVVYGPNGRSYGDPTLLRLAAENGRLGESIPSNARSALDWISGIGGVLGLAGLIAFKSRA
jgi:hypothetical protein